MEEKKIPYARMLFVCTHSREDGRVSCANPGRPGKEIAGELKKTVKAMGLKHRVRVTKTGCQDLCGQGPIVSVWPEGAVHTATSLEDVPSLLKRYVEPLKDD